MDVLGRHHEDHLIQGVGAEHQLHAVVDGLGLGVVEHVVAVLAAVGDVAGDAQSDGAVVNGAGHVLLQHVLEVEFHRLLLLLNRFGFIAGNLRSCLGGCRGLGFGCLHKAIEVSLRPHPHLAVLLDGVPRRLAGAVNDTNGGDRCDNAAHGEHPIRECEGREVGADLDLIADLVLQGVCEAREHLVCPHELLVVLFDGIPIFVGRCDRDSPSAKLHHVSGGIHTFVLAMLHVVHAVVIADVFGDYDLVANLILLGMRGAAEHIVCPAPCAVVLSDTIAGVFSFFDCYNLAAQAQHLRNNGIAVASASHTVSGAMCKVVFHFDFVSNFVLGH